MPFKQVLDLHTLILARVGRDYVDTWDDPDDFPETSSAGHMQHWLIQGAYYALSHLEDDDEWYTHD